MTGELRVNIAELRAGALGFKDAADALPDPPSAFPSLGTDRLAQALTNRTNEVESSLHDTMPTTRSDARTTATNIGTAADRYEKTDQQAHSDVNARLAEFDSKFGSSDSGGGGGMDAMGQFGQLMQMPMQMAQQLGQVPMQMAQQLGQIPQTIMQSVQQLGQMGGGLGQGGAGPEGPGAGSPGGPGSAAKQEGATDGDDRQNRDDRSEQKDEGEQREGAAAPDADTQRAPTAGPSAEAAPGGPKLEAAPAQPPRRPPVDPSVLL
ncbi:type VII secretion target [Mycolicibacterium septicum]|uniref:type VII secretion target n=1 Tax=Mycolicibacterium septicum TaxID=98668 RepID=UPI0023E1C656|nr:type VII secretion target [Mycolicibacterium septicum]MDF3341337.1 type VII secretion target [Mycolicibacterium septicum]